MKQLMVIVLLVLSGLFETAFAQDTQSQARARQFLIDVMSLGLGEALRLDPIPFKRYQSVLPDPHGNRVAYLGSLLEQLGQEKYAVEITGYTGTQEQDMDSRMLRARSRAETVMGILQANGRPESFLGVQINVVDEFENQQAPAALTTPEPVAVVDPVAQARTALQEAQSRVEQASRAAAELHRRAEIDAGLAQQWGSKEQEQRAERVLQWALEADDRVQQARDEVSLAETELQAAIAAAAQPSAVQPDQPSVPPPEDEPPVDTVAEPNGVAESQEIKPARVVVQVIHAAIKQTEPPAWRYTYGAPEIEEQFGFYGETTVSQFAISEPGLAGIVRGTIDFWVTPEWRFLPDHDPAVITLMSSDGSVRFAAHVQADRSALALWDGSDGYHAVPFAFSSERPAHVALITSGETTRVYIDGEQRGGDLPVGYNAAVATDTLIVGAGPEGVDPFRGRIARVRVWAESLSTDLLDQMRNSETIVPEPGSILRRDLVLVTQPDPITRILSLQSVPQLQNPQPGWWALAGSRELRIHNRNAFEAGLEPPLFSQTQQAFAQDHAGRTANVNAGNSADAILDAADAALHPHFSQDELLRIKLAEGVPKEAFHLPPDLRSRYTQRFVWRSADPNHAILIADGVDGITRLQLDRCYFDERLVRRWQCADLNRDGRVETFDRDEYLVGISWIRSVNDELRWLVYYTNKRVSVPRGVRNYRRLPGDRSYQMFLPDGIAAAAIDVHYADQTKTRPIGVELVPTVHVEQPGIVVYSTTGRAIRFARRDETTFYPISMDQSLYGALADRPVDRPELKVLSPQRLTLSGVADDIQLLASPPAVTLTDTFNNTFVSLSKAVNLQANYVGYDLLQMDPLHLTDTGSSKQVFKLPAGDSTNYYDANRIFVPRGLRYRPEYTGRNHSTVHSSDTYAEYRDSFSNTVTTGIDGKLAPFSFSTSLRMSEARQSISENKISKTLGLSKSIFYDLILDKSQISLSEEFIADIERLLQSSNYSGFVESYGSHYPSAVVYGGLGVLEIDATERMRQTLREQGVGLKMEMGVLLDAETQTKASFGFEHNTDHAKTFRNIVGSQAENFYWIGGTHAGVEHNSWSVGTDGVVPVHVALRPIHELLSPIFFDDPAITIRLRMELKRYIEGRNARASRLLPYDQGDPVWTLEARVDRVVCTDESRDSLVAAGQSSGARVPTQNIVKQFPMIFFRAKRNDNRYLRNFIDDYGTHDPDPDKVNQAISVNCPSQSDILPQSPFMQNNLLARYRVTAADISTDLAVVDVLDRRDFEHWVIYPPKHIPESQKRVDAFLAGFTLGTSVLVEEVFTEDGSSLVAHDADVPSNPGFRYHSQSLRLALCSGGRCPPLDEDRLDRISGRWFRHSVVMNMRGCEYCPPRRVDYSVRIFQ